jgi:hypothetical protein
VLTRSWPVFFWIALCTVACSTGVDPQKFAAVHRAGRAVAEHVTSGVSYAQYADLVGTYSTEVSLAADTATTDRERALVATHRAALTAYRDALTVWSQDVQGTRTLHASSPDYKRIADDYGVPGQGTGADFSFTTRDAREAAWTKAAALLTQATAQYSEGQ